jgi:hypothetical protein
VGGQARTDLADATASLDCLSPIPSGSAFPCAVSAQGLGDAPTPHLLLQLHLSSGILHAGHDRGGTFDADTRVVTFRVARDTPRTFRVDFIADPGAAGTELILAASLRSPDGREALGRPNSASVHVGPQLSVDTGIAVLPVRPIWVLVALILSIPLGAAIVGGLRRRWRAGARAPRRPGHLPLPRDTVMTPVMLALVCAVAMAIASPAAIESVRSVTSFVETRCTILDRIGAASFTENSLTSIAVLGYATPEGRRVSTGFDVRGTFGHAGNATAFQEFAAGRDYPCWYDPSRPARVVLRRGASGGAWLALIFGLGLAWAISRAARAWRA